MVMENNFFGSSHYFISQMAHCLNTWPNEKENFQNDELVWLEKERRFGLLREECHLLSSKQDNFFVNLFNEIALVSNNKTSQVVYGESDNLFVNEKIIKISTDFESKINILIERIKSQKISAIEIREVLQDCRLLMKTAATFHHGIGHILKEKSGASFVHFNYSRIALNSKVDKKVEELLNAIFDNPKDAAFLLISKINADIKTKAELYEQIYFLNEYFNNGKFAVHVMYVLNDKHIDYEILSKIFAVCIDEINRGGMDNIQGSFKKNDISFSYFFDSSRFEICINTFEKVLLLDLVSGKMPENGVSLRPPVDQKQLLKIEKSVRPIFDNISDVFDQDISDYNSELDESRKKYLKNVFSIIDCKNIIALKDIEFKDEKIKFLNTLVKIGEFFERTFSSSGPLYFTGSSKQFLNCFPYAIFNDTVVVVNQHIKSGGYKEVYAAFILNTKEPVIYFNVQGRNVQSTLDEVNLTNRLAANNPYLISQFEWAKKNVDRLNMLQFPYDGDAMQLNSATTWKQLLACCDMAQGIATLHDQGYIHSDIKLDNFFIFGKVNRNQPFLVKVADLGLSHEKSAPTKGCTLGYAAPELLKDSFYKANPYRTALTEPVSPPLLDSFSLGCSIYQILASKIDWLPFIDGKEKSEIAKLYRCNSGEVPFGFLSQCEIDKLINELKTAINQDKKLFYHEKMLKIKMVDVCRSLMMIDSAKRITCHEAAKQFKEIVIC